MDKVSDDDLKKFVTSDPPWNTMRTARMAQEIITSRERIDQLEKALREIMSSYHTTMTAQQMYDIARKALDNK
jgi:tRNA C32,U32 (ribose-2'-O)-methylase TrmJ